MNDMAFYARLHAEAMADESERRGDGVLAIALRVRGAARAMDMAREVENERGN